MRMNTIGAWAISILLAVTGSSSPNEADADTVEDRPECVTVRTAARSTGAGYDHVVYVRNQCSVAVKCMIATNVDPEPPLELVVPSGVEKGVVTRTHAKRRTFKPVVSCERRAKAERIDRRVIVARLVQTSSRWNE